MDEGAYPSPKLQRQFAEVYLSELHEREWNSDDSGDFERAMEDALAVEQLLESVRAFSWSDPGIQRFCSPITRKFL